MWPLHRQRWGWIVLFWSVLLVSLQGQTVSFSGYGVVLPFAMRYQTLPVQSFIALPQENRALLLRLRMRPEWDISDALFVRLEYEADYLYYQHPFFDYTPGITVSTRQYFNWQRTFVNARNRLGRHFIDRLFVAWEWENGRMVVGRQRISWGTGRVWNPTDLFNPLSPTAFDRVEKDGADAVNIQWYPGDFSDVQFVWNPTRAVPEGNGAVHLRSKIGTYDVSVLTGRFDRRWVVGGDVTGNIGKAAIRGEWLYDFGNAEKAPFVKYIVGADNQFTPRLYALVEYHFNGEGKRHPREYEFDRLFRGEILNVGRQYIFVMGQYQVWALVNVGLAWSQNLEDHSGYWYPSLDMNAGDNLAVTVGYQHFYGEFFTEYGYFPRIAFLRVQYYF